jgi:hypothetical protein
MVCERNSNVLRRITTLLIISCFLTVVLCVNTAAALPGSGTQEDPWRIESLADFDEFASDPNYWDDCTRLQTDVNLAGRTYTTAVIAPDIDSSKSGFQGTAFTGVFDGNDHKVINLTIDDGGAGNIFVGLFGYINRGEVKNLGLEGGSVSGEGYLGGLVGTNFGSISNCYSTGDVTGGGSDVGGLVGVNRGNVSNCYSTGDVNGVEYVGGLVGSNAGYGRGNITNSYSSGSVSGTSSMGGLVGGNSGTVLNCYSTGSVIGEYEVGGLLGENSGGDNSGSVLNCYSTGDVTGISGVGGLVGYNESVAIEWSFWDVQTSGEPNMCGYQEYGTVCDPNCGKTTAEMQTKSTFTDAGWDFVEIWLINEGATYPVLRQEIRSDLNGDDSVNMLDFAIFADHWLEGTAD